MYPGRLTLGAGTSHWIGLLAAIMMISLCPTVWASESFIFPIEGERARVGFVQGEVQRQAVTEGRWTALTLGVFVQAGERVRTMKRARLELQLPDKSVVRFDEDSDFRLTKATYAVGEKKRQVRFSMLLGKTWANVQKSFGSSMGFELETNNAVVGIRGTVFRMNVADDNSALIRVYSGSVTVRKPQRIPGPGEPGSLVQRVEGPKRVAGPQRVSMEDWVRIVGAMQQLRVSPDGIPSVTKTFSAEEDLNDWVRWNLGRDLQL
jgi:hypothetical protein